MPLTIARRIMRERKRGGAYRCGDDGRASTVSAVAFVSVGVWHVSLSTTVLPLPPIDSSIIVDGGGVVAHVVGYFDTTGHEFYVDAAPSVSDKVTILRAPDMEVAWSLRPEPTVFEGKVYQDCRFVLNRMLYAAALRVVYTAGSTVVGGDVSAAQTVTVPISTATWDYSRRVGVPREVARAVTFQALIECSEGGSDLAFGGFAVTWQGGQRSLSR